MKQDGQIGFYDGSHIILLSIVFVQSELFVTVYTVCVYVCACMCVFVCPLLANGSMRRPPSLSFPAFLSLLLCAFPLTVSLSFSCCLQSWVVQVSISLCLR